VGAQERLPILETGRPRPVSLRTDFPWIITARQLLRGSAMMLPEQCIGSDEHVWSSRRTWHSQSAPRRSIQNPEIFVPEA
jgi:hypothetical protein